MIFAVDSLVNYLISWLFRLFSSKSLFDGQACHTLAGCNTCFQGPTLLGRALVVLQGLL
ncbi:unnamed protein product [Amoebophrya sp. A25]|nr:unnamed protein product [Amoebophrya sp. A25]|eukprot:GSA25T00012454001.1